MKKIIALLLCLALVSLVACTDKSTSKEANPSANTPNTADTDSTGGDSSVNPDGSLKWNDYVFNGSFSDESVTSAPLVSLTITLPSIPAKADITAYYDNVASKLKESAQTYYLDIARGNYQMAQGGSGIFVPVVIETNYKVARNDGVLFSVVRETYENTGGAHPINTKACDVFRVSDGAKLIFEDVFTVDVAQAESKLTPFIHTLMDEFSAAVGGDAYYDNAKTELFNMWESDDFYLTDDSLVLIWQAYSIAPYAAGIQEFAIPLSSISDIVDAQWITK